MSRERLAAALRDHVERSHDRKATRAVMGEVKRVGSDGMSVEVADHGFVIDPDDLLIGQQVAQYDEDYGIKIGDSVTLLPLANGDYVAVAVMTGTEATARRFDGLLVYGASAPGPADGNDKDFWIQTDADPNNWKIYGPKLAGSWPTGIPIRGPVGAVGPTGPAGTTGAAGTNFLTGHGAPSAGTGSNGDTYFDIDSGLLYTPKAAGVWPAGAQMVSTVVIGSMFDWPAPARSIPAKYLACFGQSVLRATYVALFAALCPLVNTATVTLASPGVFTTPTAHGLVIGDPVFFTTTGALPTGMAANTTYYVMTVPSGTTFTIGTTRTIAPITGIATVTTAINTSVTQSGVHSVFQTPHGVADATHFNIPDFRGRVGIGKDTMGGSAASRLLWTPADGLSAGEAAHLLLSAESGIVDHTHLLHATTGGAVVANLPGNLGGTNDINYTTVGSGNADAVSAHNNVPPGVTVEKIIFAGV